MTHWQDVSREIESFIVNKIKSKNAVALWFLSAFAIELIVVAVLAVLR